MLQRRIEQAQMLMMDINKVREQCNALLRELSIDQALLNARVEMEEPEFKEAVNDIAC